MVRCSVSWHNRGGSMRQAHNRRDPDVVNKEPHIDLKRPHENWRDIPELEAYCQAFEKSLKEYAIKVKKQRHPERAMTVQQYYAKVKNDSKRRSRTRSERRSNREADGRPVTSSEMILQVGNRDNHPDLETTIQIYQDYLKEFEERNTTLKIFGIYFHDDEQGWAHIHVDYLSVADGYRRGPKVQQGVDRAIRQLGYKPQMVPVMDRDGQPRMNENGELVTRLLTPQAQWTAVERMHFQEVCRKYGVDVVEILDGRQHLPKEEYAALMHAEAELLKKQKQVAAMEQDLQNWRKANADINKVDSIVKTERRGKVTVNKQDYEKLVHAAKAHQMDQVRERRTSVKSQEAEKIQQTATDAMQNKNDLEYANYRLKSENQQLRHENKHLKTVLTKTLKATWSDSRPVMISIRNDVQTSFLDVFQLATQTVRDVEKYQEDGQNGMRM